MSRALVILASRADRERVKRAVDAAPVNSRVEIKAPRRSSDQNSLLWARLTDIARQLPWHGSKLVADDWRLIFLDALKREMRIAPNIDGTGFVNLGRSSSDLSREEFNVLLALIEAFAAEHGVELTDLQSEARDGDGANNPSPVAA